MDKKLDKKMVLQSVEEGLFRGGVHLFDSIDSTNDWSLEEIGRGRALPFVCLAEHQSRGRGRRGRHWLSPPGANIYLSLAWHFRLSPDSLGVLPLALGVAVKRALLRIGINDAWVKWPNDVLIEDRKIAGILVETRNLHTDACSAVIGIGVNYRMPENSLADSGMRWTDVVHAGGGMPADRSTLAGILVNEAAAMCRQYQRKAQSLLIDIEDELGVLTGRDVCLHFDNGEQLTGRVTGINDTGELRVLVNGQERIFSSADVSFGKHAEVPVAGDLC
ncbi:MAG: biotin--[acetyl-CoA-carboxylase] ligase [Gammaproteobacteria bacterium]|nr:biotin--[acetyl-CoA-carboxylase] ligase [Gammaproteobacteria bacterium]